MEAFGLLHFLQALLPQGPASNTQTANPQPLQEPKTQEPERVIEPPAEQKTDSQNAYLLFIAQHERRAKHTHQRSAGP